MADKNIPEEPEGGYGKPPKASQFQPGQSGNPKGRPKGSGNIHKIIAKHAAKKVVVIENGVEKKMQKLDVVISSMFNKAAKGDVGAARLLVALLQNASELSTPENQSGYSEADLAVMLEQADWQAMLVDLKAEASDENQF